MDYPPPYPSSAGRPKPTLPPIKVPSPARGSFSFTFPAAEPPRVTTPSPKLFMCAKCGSMDCPRKGGACDGIQWSPVGNRATTTQNPNQKGFFCTLCKKVQQTGRVLLCVNCMEQQPQQPFVLCLECDRENDERHNLGLEPLHPKGHLFVKFWV